MEGQWHADPSSNEISLRGMQTNGSLTVPYMAWVQVSEFDQQKIVGMSTVGEFVTFQRLSWRGLSQA